MVGGRCAGIVGVLYPGGMIQSLFWIGRGSAGGAGTSASRSPVRGGGAAEE